MSQGKIAKQTKLLLFLCAILMLLVLVLPLWRIELDAPQYPEGLKLLIYANKIAGNVDIINGLNHYIGMKTLHTEDFVEFTILPYLIVFLSAIFVVAALIGTKKAMLWVFIIFAVLSIICMVDFWRWEYNYGHDLDPNAAIVVPGMAYQPPLIGFKQLLNFGAYSIPDFGGMIFILVGILLLIGLFLELRKKKIVQTTQIVMFFSVNQLYFFL